MQAVPGLFTGSMMSSRTYSLSTFPFYYPHWVTFSFHACHLMTARELLQLWMLFLHTHILRKKEETRHKWLATSKTVLFERGSFSWLSFDKSRSHVYRITIGGKVEFGKGGLPCLVQENHDSSVEIGINGWLSGHPNRSQFYGHGSMRLKWWVDDEQQCLP